MKIFHDKKGHTFAYTGDISPFIWILMISIACIIGGVLIPELSFVIIIGVILFLIWLWILFKG